MSRARPTGRTRPGRRLIGWKSAVLGASALDIGAKAESSRPSEPPARRIAARLAAVVLVCGLGFAASGCTTLPTDPEERQEVLEQRDPLEGLNRGIFAVNLTLDTFLLRPAAVLYRDWVPEPGKDIVRNFVNNLRLPFTFVNDVLQGEFDRAQTSFNRFFVNSTAGVFGMFDMATGLGLEFHEEDIGQTLATYGVGDGPYLMLPVFGPSNVRDAFGLAVEWAIDPVNVFARATGHADLLFVRSGADAIDDRSRNIAAIDDLQYRSLDFYAAVRSLYRQRRADAIANGDAAGVRSRPSLSTEPSSGSGKDEEATGAPSGDKPGPTPTGSVQPSTSPMARPAHEALPDPQRATTSELAFEEGAIMRRASVAAHLTSLDRDIVARLAGPAAHPHVNGTAESAEPAGELAVVPVPPKAPATKDGSS